MDDVIEPASRRRNRELAERREYLRDAETRQAKINRLLPWFPHVAVVVAVPCALVPADVHVMAALGVVFAVAYTWLGILVEVKSRVLAHSIGLARDRVRWLGERSAVYEHEAYRDPGPLTASRHEPLYEIRLALLVIAALGTAAMIYGTHYALDHFDGGFVSAFVGFGLVAAYVVVLELLLLRFKASLRDFITRHRSTTS